MFPFLSRTSTVVSGKLPKAGNNVALYLLPDFPPLSLAQLAIDLNVLSIDKASS